MIVEGNEIDEEQFNTFLKENSYVMNYAKEYLPNLTFFLNDQKEIDGLTCLIHIKNVTIVDELMIHYSMRNDYKLNKKIMLYILDEIKKSGNTILRYNVRIENLAMWNFHAKRGSIFTGLSGQFINTINREFKNEK